MLLSSHIVVCFNALLPTATNFNVFLLLSTSATSCLHVAEVKSWFWIVGGTRVNLFHLEEGGEEGKEGRGEGGMEEGRGRGKGTLEMDNRQHKCTGARGGMISSCGCRGTMTMAASIVISSPLSFISSSVSISTTSNLFPFPVPALTLSTI